MENIEELRQKLKDTCEKTETSLKGMELLVNYYQNDLHWSEEKALKYALGLFRNGTISKIKLIGKDGKEI